MSTSLTVFRTAGAAALALIFAGCASTTTIPVAVQARLNTQSAQLNKPFPVRIVVADSDPAFTPEQRGAMAQALKGALSAKGYAVREGTSQPGGVVRVSYTVDKPVAELETGWVPTFGLYSGYGYRRFGFGLGTEIPITRQRTRYVNELSITAFDEDAGWVWNASAQVDNDEAGVAPYPDLYRLLQDYLGREGAKTFRLPKAGQPASGK